MSESQSKEMKELQERVEALENQVCALESRMDALVEQMIEVKSKDPFSGAFHDRVLHEINKAHQQQAPARLREN